MQQPEWASAATLARTVLAVCHEVWCERAHGSERAPVSAGLVAAGARPHLVPADPSHWFAPGTSLRCRADVQGVGVLWFYGTTEPPARAEDDPVLARALAEHDGCLLEGARSTGLALVPFQVFNAVVAAPGQKASAPLTAADLRRVQPDWLLAQADRLVEHLECDHAADLVHLAAAHGAAASAVAVHRLTAHGVTLVCLDDDGVTNVELGFDPPVNDPADLWRRLQSAPPVG